MPNWCNTTYVFHGPADNINALYNKIKAFTDGSLTNKTKTDFGDMWLGNILIGAGLSHTIDATNPTQRLSCRGTIDYIEDDIEKTATSFRLNTETAWIPMPQMWAVVIQKLQLDIGFTFQADEPGCEIYCIYDPRGYKDFTDDIVIESASDTDNNIADISGYYSEKDAVNIINDALKKNCKTIDDAIAAADEYNAKHINNPDGGTDDYVNVYKIKKIDSYDAYTNKYYIEEQ